MHELSIIASIIDIAQETARQKKLEKFDEVELDIGELSGVVIEALRFAADISGKGTALEGAKWIFNIIPGKAKCRKCSHEFGLNEFQSGGCPQCGAFDMEIISGKEMNVKSFVVYNQKNK